LHSRVGEVGCGTESVAGVDPRGKSARAHSWALSRFGVGHSGARPSRAASPCHSKLLRRVRARDRRQPGRTAARGCAAPAQRNVAMPATSTPRDLRFLDPAVIARLGTMELKARTVVEGFLSGLHRSPFKGFSVEFAEYRQYMPGDDLST